MYDTKTGLATSTLIAGLIFSILTLLLSKIGLFDQVYPVFEKATENIQLNNLSFFQNLSEDWDFFFNIQGVREENVSLTSENQQLKTSINALQLQIKDYSLISKQAQFNKEYSQLPVRVIKYSDNQTEIYINKGADEGVKVNDVAVLDNNLLGIVSECNANYAKIELVSNNSSSIPVIINETGSKGVAVGEKANTINVQGIPNDATLKIGDTVISAGSDGVVPYGLILGQITSISSDPAEINQSAIIKSLVKLSDLESIFIIVNYP